jgi:hypothetical protein
MEWMLQAVDEVDDVVAALMHRWLGLRIEAGVFVGFGMTMAAVGAAFAIGLGAAS